MFCHIFLSILSIILGASFGLNAVNGIQQDTQDTQDKGKTEEQKKENKVEEREKDPNPSNLLKIGNLSFPVSQQPTPLISFGQNILNKKQTQAQLITLEFEGKKEYSIVMAPALLYAFTDDFSIFMTLPINVRHRLDHSHSSSPGDFFIQLEYDFYTKEHYTYYDQMTVVANVSIPTGSAKKNPPTGVGSNSFFLGTTYARMGIDWFYFTSYGGVMNTTSHRTRFGHQLLYQYGVGRRIYSNAEWLLAWMVEFNGYYSWRDIIEGMTNPDSGGNIIYATPSLFLSSNESLVVQLGIGFPIYQRFNGHQSRQKYLLALTLSWLF